MCVYICSNKLYNFGLRYFKLYVELLAEKSSAELAILKMLAFSTLLARGTVLLEWKSAHPPKTSFLVKDQILFFK